MNKALICFAFALILFGANGVLAVFNGSFFLTLEAGKNLTINMISYSTSSSVNVKCNQPDMNKTINLTSLFVANIWSKYDSCLLEVNSFEKDEERCEDEFASIGATGCYNAANSLDAKIYGSDGYVLKMVQMNRSFMEGEAKMLQDKETEVSAKNTRIKDLEDSLGKCGEEKKTIEKNWEGRSSTQRLMWGVGGLLLGIVGYSQYQKKREKESIKKSGGLPKPFI